MKDPSRTRNSSSGAKTKSRSPLEQIKEEDAASRGEKRERETELIFHVTIESSKEERAPVGLLLGLMTLQTEEQQRLG